MTNADRIRSMNDEELAQMLCGDGIGFDCYDCQWDVRKGERCNMQCHDNCLAWLKQEAKEDKP